MYMATGLFLVPFMLYMYMYLSVDGKYTLYLDSLSLAASYKPQEIIVLVIIFISANQLLLCDSLIS